MLGVAVAAAGVAGITTSVVPGTASFAVGAPTFTGEAVVVGIASFGERGTDVVDYRDGATVRLALPVTNTGRLPARITSVDLGGQHLPLLSVVGGSGPVTVGPGSTTRVELVGVLGNCRYYHEREMSTYADVRLRFDVLGRSGERTVALPRPMVVHSPMIVGCPDRKLNRQALNRRD